MNDQLVAWAAEEHPHEACGVIVQGEVIKLRNVASDPEHFFAFDGEDLVSVYTKYNDIEGVWHSHPNGKVTPSQPDWDHHPKGKRMLIVAGGEVHEYGEASRPNTSDQVPQSSGAVGD